MQRPLILVTNDDGILAKGIKSLVKVAKKFGDVVVVAPNKPQSGQGHAITIVDPIRIHKVDVFEGVDAFECTGTPADCVKLAKNVLLKDRKIDLCISGINHGSNASINIIYSGTMSAAREASLSGIPSIGFSLLNFDHDADFSGASWASEQIISKVLDTKNSDIKLLNVNIPDLKTAEIKGIKVCTQGEGNWVEDFQESKDPREQRYYWLAGRFEASTDDPRSDLNALKDGYVSVVPCIQDLTDHAKIDEINYLAQ